MFERIYGQSVIRWYVQRAVPKVLSEFESIDPSAHLRGLITLGLPRTVATPAQSLEKEKENEINRQINYCNSLFSNVFPSETPSDPPRIGSI